MPKYYLYILQCKDGTLYTGITTDVRRRFKEHLGKAGGGAGAGIGARYTRSHQPEKIVYTEAHPTRSAALKREAEIKKWRREKKLTFIYAKTKRAKAG